MTIECTAVEQPHKSRTQKLADALLADRQREAKHHDVATCRACGHGFMRRGESDYCSERCREWIAAGNPPYDPRPLATVNDVPIEQWRIVAGPPGCINSKTGYHPFAFVCDQVMERQHSRRRVLDLEAEHKSLKRFMVAADIPFKSESIDYLPKGNKSVLRRPAWSATATPSQWSDWRISGKFGSVFVDGDDGYLLTVETRDPSPGSFMANAPEWADVKRRLSFCRFGAEGFLYLAKLPTAQQATAICAVLGIPKNRTAKTAKAAVAEAA